jgi:antitoxin MazE
MEINLINIGNSKGFRIPSSILEQMGFERKAKLDLKDGGLYIRPHKEKNKLRAGWDEAADNYLVSVLKEGKKTISEEFADWNNSNTSFDNSEWTW